jgi:hypothetical protein
LLTVSVTLLVQAWYCYSVDFPWLADWSISVNRRSANLPEATRAVIAQNVRKPQLLGILLISALLAPLVMRTLAATYFNLAGKLFNLGGSFRQWFAIVWWATLPLFLGIVAGELFLAFSATTQIRPHELAVLSLNELFVHKAYGARGFNALSLLTVLHPIAWWFTILGARALSGRSLAFCAAFTLIPIALFYVALMLLPF